MMKFSEIWLFTSIKICIIILSLQQTQKYIIVRWILYIIFSQMSIGNCYIILVICS